MSEDNDTEDTMDETMETVADTSGSTVFAFLSNYRMYIAAYLGLFAVIFLFGLFTNKTINFNDLFSESGRTSYFSAEFADLDLAKFYNMLFLLQNVVLLGLAGYVAMNASFEGDRKAILQMILGSYLVLSALSLIFLAIDNNGFDATFSSYMLLLLGIVIILMGLVNMQMLTLPENILEQALGASSLLYGIGLFLNEHLLKMNENSFFTRNPDLPAFAGFFSIQRYNIDLNSQSLDFVMSWIYPTLHEWLFGGIFFLITGIYFLVRGFNIGVSESMYTYLEDGVLLSLSLALLMFGIINFVTTIFAGMMGLLIVLLKLVNIIAILLGVVIGYPVLQDYIPGLPDLPI